MTKIIDKFDKKILSEIEFDYNKSHSIIAKKIKRSKSFVTYRINRLEQKKIISYSPLIDYSKLGMYYYRITIETTLERKEINDIITKLNLKMVWFIEKFDKDNFVFVILAENNYEFQKIWDLIYNQIQKDLINKDISILFKIVHLPLSFIHNRRENCYITGNNEKIIISDLQYQILIQLLNYPKINKMDLCSKLNINIITLKKNIKFLEQNSIILAYQTKINKEKLNILHYKIWIDYDNLNKNNAIEILKNYKNIVYITDSTFQYMIEFEVFVFNNKELNDLIKKLKNEIKIKRISFTQVNYESKLI